MIRKVDAVMVRVPDLEQGLAFYRDYLGHALIWRTVDSCGLAMAGSDAELVLSTRLGPETDLLVESAEAAARFQAGGGQLYWHLDGGRDRQSDGCRGWGSGLGVAHPVGGMGEGRGAPAGPQVEHPFQLSTAIEP